MDLKPRDFDRLEALYERNPKALARAYRALSVIHCHIVSWYDLTEEQQADYDDESDKSQSYFVSTNENSTFCQSLKTCMKNGTPFHGAIGISNNSGYGVILSDCGETALL